MSRTPENVFCLARADLDAAGLLTCGPADLQRLLALPQHFLPRPRAENDPDYKQVIPYQVFTCHGKIFVFRRGGGVGEQRLAGRLSIGVGGHINDKDRHQGRMTPATLHRALLRERHEELHLAGPVTTRFLGLINDDSDPVGRVHLGAVFVCTTAERDHVQLREGGEDLGFEGWWEGHKITAHQARFEKWSLLALRLVAQAGLPGAG